MRCVTCYKRECHVGSTIIETVFQYKQVVLRSNESTLPGLTMSFDYTLHSCTANTLTKDSIHWGVLLRYHKAHNYIVSLQFQHGKSWDRSIDEPPKTQIGK